VPYILPEARKVIDSRLQELVEHMKGTTEGELNYMMTKLVLAWLGDNANYSAYASVTGVIENVKQELYRRVISDYEDKKKVLNGDVF